MEQEKLRFKDAATGIYSRDYFLETGEYLLALATRGKAPLTICAVDIDYLNRVNEVFGKRIGDEVIKTVAMTVDLKSRRSDLAGYLGAGTIGLILYDISGVNTGMVLNGLRKKVEYAIKNLNYPKLKATVSIGACMIQGEMDKEKLEVIYKRAFTALKNAKEAGRNKVVVY